MITLEEFQKLSGLSDSSLVWLLTHNQLACSVSEESGIMVDPESTSVKTLIRSLRDKKTEVLAGKERVIIERLARIVGEQLEEVAHEAIATFLAERGVTPTPKTDQAKK